jgi:hypothetical protein
MMEQYPIYPSAIFNKVIDSYGSSLKQWFLAF